MLFPLLDHSIVSFRGGGRKAGDAPGFTLIEVILCVAFVTILAGLYARVLSKARETGYIAIDLENMRRILQASVLYSSENNDQMAHPTWGGDLTGPDGWAYRTSNKNGPVPGALAATAGSCAGRDVNSTQFTNQLAFFRVGQVTQYLPDVMSAWCPKDVATRGAEKLRSAWLSRPVKVTSYLWNGSIGGYTGPKGKDLAGRTYKISTFRPDDWQMWEGNDANPFSFTDAADNPETPGESPSLRHSGVPGWYTIPSSRRDVPGGAVIGRFDGAGEVVSLRRVYDLTRRIVPAPNAALNGPGYAR